MNKYVIFDYDDKKWVSGIRPHAFLLVNNKFDALKFPSLEIADKFICVLEAMYPDIFFRAMPFDEYC